MVTTHGSYETIFPLNRQTPMYAYTVILELRLYAMYGRSKKILLLLFALISCEATAMGVLFGVVKADLIGG